MNATFLALHLQVLEECKDRIRTHRQAEPKPSIAASAPRTPAAARQRREQMRRWLAQEPGLTTRELARRLGISDVAAGVHRRALEAEGKR